MPAYDLVIPTIGRPSLHALLNSLVAARGPRPGHVFIVDDRKHADPALVLDPSGLGEETVLHVIRAGGRGPAAARNAGWRSSSARWIAFLDDDVLVQSDWFERLHADVAAASEFQAGSQGRVRVPLPSRRAPTDWERNVAGLESSAWITADMAYKRSVLEALGGFDERFRRAYREDADFALRVFHAGFHVARGTRGIDHPVRPADAWISVRLQAGNADDLLMRALHGADWRERACAPRGAFGQHAIAVGCAGGAVLAVAARRKRVAALLIAGWAAITARFAWRRIAPGPKTQSEISTMVVTSAAIPFAAVYHRMRGLLFLGKTLRSVSQ